VKARTITALAVATASIVALAGCATTSGSSTPDKLQFILSGDGAQGGGYAAMAEKYEEETGIEVEIVDVPYEDLVTKLRNGAQANDLPALARASAIDPIWGNQLLDLSSIAEGQEIVPELLVADPNDGDKVKALPSDLTAVGLYLNTSLFDQAGVAYPGPDEVWSWDEYVAAIKEVQAKAGAKYGMVMDASAHRLRSFLYEFGSKGVEKGADGRFDMNDESRTALEYFKSLNDDSFMPKSVWLSGDDPSALFKSGQVVAYYSGVWQVTDFSQNITAFDWASVRTPAQPVQATNLGTNWIVGFSGTGVEKQTRDFIEWLYAPENYAELSAISGFLPATVGLEVDYPSNAQAFDVYNAEIAASDPIAAEQSAGALLDGYNGKILDVEPLKDETVKYLADEQDLDTTIENIITQTQAALGD
jgi:alpha-1,4-digalacturonate transport system substrate-binding protein